VAVVSPVLNIFANHIIVYEVCPRSKVINLYVQIILKWHRRFFKEKLLYLIPRKTCLKER